MEKLTSANQRLQAELSSSQDSLQGMEESVRRATDTIASLQQVCVRVCVCVCALCVHAYCVH